MLAAQACGLTLAAFRNLLNTSLEVIHHEAFRQNQKCAAGQLGVFAGLQHSGNRLMQIRRFSPLSQWCVEIVAAQAHLNSERTRRTLLRAKLPRRAVSGLRSRVAQMTTGPSEQVSG